MSSWSRRHVPRSSNGRLMQLGTMPAGIDGHQTAALTKSPNTFLQKISGAYPGKSDATALAADGVKVKHRPGKILKTPVSGWRGLAK